MLLDSKYTLIHKLQITLTFDNDVKKAFIINTGDIIRCEYNSRGSKKTIKGRVDKIGVTYRSTIGDIGDSVYLKIDGSDEYYGRVEHIKPCNIIDLSVCETSGVTVNPVTSVDNDDMKILLIRESETGIFQYSKDGVKWISIIDENNDEVIQADWNETDEKSDSFIKNKPLLEKYASVDDVAELKNEIIGVDILQQEVIALIGE